MSGAAIVAHNRSIAKVLTFKMQVSFLSQPLDGLPETHQQKVETRNNRESNF